MPWALIRIQWVGSVAGLITWCQNSYHGYSNKTLSCWSRLYSALLVDQITKSGMKYVSKLQDLQIFVSKLNKYE